MDNLTGGIWFVKKKRLIACFSVIGILFLFGVSFAGNLTPEETVTNFYNAIKDGKYEKAYDYVAEKMKDGRDRKKWADDWKKTIDVSQAVIFGFTVSSVKIEGDKATLRVETNSKDIFNKNGIIENETDYLVKENGVWKIERTEVDLPDL